MAIDTKAKRASVQAYTFGLMRPPPDGAVEEGDRATVGWLYSGLDYGVPSILVRFMHHLRSGLRHLTDTFRHMRTTLRHYREDLWHRGGNRD